MNGPKYLPIALLGAGGMGRVELALACGTLGPEQLVVLKRVRVEDTPDERIEHMRDLIWEASVSARIDHPNVVTTIDLDRMGDCLLYTSRCV